MHTTNNGELSIILQFTTLASLKLKTAVLKNLTPKLPELEANATLLFTQFSSKLRGSFVYWHNDWRLQFQKLFDLNPNLLFVREVAHFGPPSFLLLGKHSSDTSTKNDPLGAAGIATLDFSTDGQSLFDQHVLNFKMLCELDHMVPPTADGAVGSIVRTYQAHRADFRLVTRQ